MKSNNRKNFLFLLLAIIFIGFSSCGKDKIIDTSINLKMTYGNEPLVMFEEVNYPDGTPMFFTRVSFFVEDFELSSEENNYKFITRDYVDLSSDHSSSSQAVIGSNIGRIELPEGDYSVSFDIGVNGVDNAKTPADFTSADVLSRTSEYWTGWKSYIFVRVEGKIDLNKDGVIDEGFALHLGGDDAFTEIICPDVKKVSEGNESISIIMDLRKFFGAASSLYDIFTTPQIHTPAHNPQVIELKGNLPGCFD